jgi:hypothetical protein
VSSRPSALDRVFPPEMNHYCGSKWVVVRLRVMVPFMALVLFLEPVLRAAMGALKPVETIGTAPGAALNNVVLIPLAVLLVLSITTIRPRT